jgi:hypothetical protein
MQDRKPKLTEKEMLEELKTWDDEVWKKFKQEKYETISLSFKLEEDDES